MVPALPDSGPDMLDERHRALLESTPDAIVIVDSSGKILFANSQAERMFGYSAGDLHGRPVELLLPERLREAHLGHRAGFQMQPRVRAMGAKLDLNGLRKDGSEFPVEISLSPLQTEGRTLVSSAIRDITWRKQVEHELQEKNLALADALRAKDQFLAGMSHELRTPLNAIIGFTGTLLMGLPGPLTPEQEKQLRTVQASGRHLLALINDLLDLAKIDAGKVEVFLEPVECVAVIDEVMATLRPEAEAKGLQFLLERPIGDPLLLRTDRRALSQIVLNLTSNAIKFTERGSVRLMVQRIDEGGRVGARISVEDSGIGIRAEDRNRLFDAFAQMDAASRRTGVGTGLGLHLSRKFAELLGGSISYRSEYGRGSTFILSIFDA